MGKLNKKKLQAIRDALYADDNAKKIFALKGHVSEITFAGCSLAKDKGGQIVLDVLAADLVGAKIRGFKQNTNEFGGVDGVQVTPHNPDDALPNKKYDDFVYETTGPKLEK